MDHATHSTSNGQWTPYFVSSDTQETRQIVGQNIVSHTLEHRSKQKRPVTVRYRTASVGTLGFNEMAYSMFGEGEATIRVPKMEKIYLCEMNLRGRMAVGQVQPTTPFRPGEIYMINANAPHAKIWQTDGHQVMIRIHQTDMEAALERRIGMPVRDALVFESTPRPASGAVGTLAKMIELLGADLEREGSFFVGQNGMDANQMLLDLMLTALPHNYSHLLFEASSELRPRHVRHAAAFIHDHYRETIGLDDLVLAGGVSKRSLHAGFRKYYGVPPMLYLRNVRLDMARLRLTQLGAGDVSVTDVALECGFTHLSKFAAAYKDRFGELPSVTLRNA
jgi:AraC-like DNA-binding protein